MSSAQNTTVSASDQVRTHSREARWRRFQRGIFPYLFLAPFLIVFAVFIIYPPVYTLNLSLYRTRLVGGTAFVGLAIIFALAGNAFAQYRFFGRDVLFGIILVSVFVPATVFAIPLYLLLSKSGLTNTLLAVIFCRCSSSARPTSIP